MEITDTISPEGIDKLKKGQILIFTNDKERIDLKITRIDRKNHRIWAERVITFRSDEIVVNTGNKRETIEEYQESK